MLEIRTDAERRIWWFNTRRVREGEENRRDPPARRRKAGEDNSHKYWSVSLALWLFSFVGFRSAAGGRVGCLFRVSKGEGKKNSQARSFCSNPQARTQKWRFRLRPRAHCFGRVLASLHFAITSTQTHTFGWGAENLKPPPPPPPPPTPPPQLKSRLGEHPSHGCSTTGSNQKTPAPCLEARA